MAFSLRQAPCKCFLSWTYVISEMDSRQQRSSQERLIMNKRWTERRTLSLASLCSYSERNPINGLNCVNRVLQSARKGIRSGSSFKIVQTNLVFRSKRGIYKKILWIWQMKNTVLRSNFASFSSNATLNHSSGGTVNRDLGNDWMDQLTLSQSGPSPRSIPLWTPQQPDISFNCQSIMPLNDWRLLIKFPFCSLIWPHLLKSPKFFSSPFLSDLNDRWRQGLLGSQSLIVVPDKEPLCSREDLSLHAASACL